ncbi:MAG: SpoIVB peptidase [Bacilli bacterium]
MFLKKTFLGLFLTFLILPICVNAYSDYIIAGGTNIGIQLNAKGVMVVGFYKVDDSYIARQAGLEVGDLITTINNEKVTSINDLIDKINVSYGDVKIGYMRSDMTKYVNLKLVKDENNHYKTGIYVKDSVTGLGTLTYIDPKTKIFGALGHEIIDRATGKVLEIGSGNIYSSTVTNIEPSSNGKPGEKNAQINTDDVNGKINENTIKGIFGDYTNKFDNMKLYKVAKPNDIKKGKAKIMTVLDKTQVIEYDINIIKISHNQATKNLLFEITDKRLLAKTNGIVQGMSGSPIIQGEYIIGAVTHVVVDNPHKGYGIFITNMLEEGEN